MLSLPTELVEVVAADLSRSELKALSSTSHRLRDALVPVLMKDMNVDSIQKLRDLAASGERISGFIRNLNVTLDIDFFDAWAEESGSSLATIVAKAAQLQSLTFQASSGPYNTPWNRISISDPSSRGLPLGFQESGADSLPLFDRLTHLDLHTISAESIRVLLARAPSLASLSVLLPDGLSEEEMEGVLDALERVPHLESLSISLAEWESRDGAGEAAYARNVLRRIAMTLPNLETLDLRTRTYDLVDGVLTWKCVDAERLCLDDFSSVVPLFRGLRGLQLPLRTPKGDATQASTTIAKLSPQLAHISWMQCVDFESKVDEYIITRSSSDCSDVTVTRVDPPQPRPLPVNNLQAGHPRRRGLSLFDTLFNKFVDPSKPSILSDIAVTFSVLMVISSTLLSPFYVIFG